MEEEKLPYVSEIENFYNPTRWCEQGFRWWLWNSVGGKSSLLKPSSLVQARLQVLVVKQHRRKELLCGQHKLVTDLTRDQAKGKLRRWKLIHCF